MCPERLQWKAPRWHADKMPKPPLCQYEEAVVVFLCPNPASPTEPGHLSGEAHFGPYINDLILLVIIDSLLA